MDGTCMRQCGLYGNLFCRHIEFQTICHFQLSAKAQTLNYLNSNKVSLHPSCTIWFGLPITCVCLLNESKFKMWANRCAVFFSHNTEKYFSRTFVNNDKQSREEHSWSTLWGSVLCVCVEKKKFPVYPTANVSAK